MSIKLTNVVKRFGPYIAVEKMDFEIGDGEFFVLLGPSGCGKTTTLRMIAGLETATEGTIEINGRDVTDVPPRQRNIAMAFQDYGLYPHMTAFENIAFPLKIRKTAQGEIKERVQRTAETINVAHLLEKRPSQMSGGERQRVSLARALVRNPDVFLMDEPLSNLDAKLRAVMRTEIKKLVTELGITTVYVTHDQVEAMAMADRIAIMSKGKMEQLDSPLQVYDHPRTQFVAEFIGSPPMNIFGAHFDSQTNLRLDRAYLGSFVQIGNLALASAKFLGSIRKPAIGLRPENVEILDTPVPKSASAVIELIEPLGQDTVVYLVIEDQRLLAVTRRRDLKVGTEVHLSADPSHVRLMDSS